MRQEECDAIYERLTCALAYVPTARVVGDSESLYDIVDTLDRHWPEHSHPYIYSKYSLSRYEEFGADGLIAEVLDAITTMVAIICSSDSTNMRMVFLVSRPCFAPETQTFYLYMNIVFTEGFLVI